MAITTVTVYEYSATVAAGLVIRTDPAEGEDLGPDEVVTLYVSLGTGIPKEAKFSYSSQAIYGFVGNA